MASVCVGCGLDVDEDGKLIVEIDPGTTCQPNHLECTETGLTVRQKRKHLRRRFSAEGTVSIADDPGFVIARAMTGYTTEDDNGTAAGLWTIQGDGSLLINCAGLYLVSQQTIVEGSTGQVVGGRARVTNGAGTPNIICTTEFNDKNGVIDLAVNNDGPEWNASAVRYIDAATSLQYISNVYFQELGQSADWAGEFCITYLGEFA